MRPATALRQTIAILGLFVGAACSGPPAVQAPAPEAANVTVFEGARLIVGDGSAPIENAVFVVENDRFVQVGRRRRGASAGRRDAREPDRQDGDAGDRRHAHAHADDPRGARRSVAAQGVLRRRRGHQPRPGHGRRRVSGARGNRAERSAASHGGPRHHDARAGPHRSAVLGDATKPKPERRCRNWPRGRSTSSRSGWTIATANTRS